MSDPSLKTPLDIESLRPGDNAAVEVEVTEELVKQFAALSLDDNPVHMSTKVAREYGFPRRVAHGVISVTTLSRLIGTRLPGPGSVWMDQAIEFTGPVYLGDTIRATVTVKRVSLAARVVILDLEVINVGNAVVVTRGTAKVKVPKKIEQAKKVVMERTIALVTGSSRGLGRAIAVALGKAGSKVVVHCRSRHLDAAQVVAEIEEAGGEAVAITADLTDPKAVERLADEAQQAFGRIDILVHNASPVIERRPWDAWDWNDFQAFFDIYLRAGWQLTQHLAPGMQERKFGRFINVLSSAAFNVPPPQMLPYITAKSALAGMSRALAVELGASNVSVNMIAPSLLVTDQNAYLGDRARQLVAARSPMKRLAELEEVAATVVYLAGPGSSFVTGAVIPVAGGEIMVP